MRSRSIIIALCAVFVLAGCSVDEQTMPDTNTATPVRRGCELQPVYPVIIEQCHIAEAEPSSSGLQIGVGQGAKPVVEVVPGVGYDPSSNTFVPGIFP